jgi:pilus assembly protein Flp/PilA
MIKFATSFLRDDSGASAAEYALILAIVGTGIAFAAAALGGAISGAISNAENCISNGAGATADAACPES